MSATPIPGVCASRSSTAFHGVLPALPLGSENIRRTALRAVPVASEPEFREQSISVQWKMGTSTPPGNR
jgi:hypothetical protein